LIINLGHEKLINNKYHITTPEQRLLNLVWKDVRGDARIWRNTKLNWNAFRTGDSTWGFYSLEKEIDKYDGQPPLPRTYP